MGREKLVEFLRKLADEVEKPGEIKISTDEWELPFNAQDQAEVEIELDDELEIEIEFKKSKNGNPQSRITKENDKTQRRTLNRRIISIPPFRILEVKKGRIGKSHPRQTNIHYQVKPELYFLLSEKIRELQ